jgi:hypothetical protein
MEKPKSSHHKKTLNSLVFQIKHPKEERTILTSLTFFSLSYSIKQAEKLHITQ